MEQYIFGRNPIKETLLAKRLKKVFVSSGFKDDCLIYEIKKQNIPVEIVDNSVLSRMVKGTTQGIVGIVKRVEYSSLEEILYLAKKRSNPVILILDGIEDPGNFGAIIRSADAFSVVGIIIKKYGQVMLNDTVYKTSTGAINFVKVAQVSNLSQAIQTLKDEGFWVVSSDGSANMKYTDLKYDFKTALIIGSEGKGISKLLLQRSDYIVKIPMTGNVNSLNASVATGILLSHICNR